MWPRLMQLFTFNLLCGSVLRRITWNSSSGLPGIGQLETAFLAHLQMSLQAREARARAGSPARMVPQ